MPRLDNAFLNNPHHLRLPSLIEISNCVATRLEYLNFWQESIVILELRRVILKMKFVSIIDDDVVQV